MAGKPKRPSLEERTVAAFARNGLNTHLLNITQELGVLQAQQQSMMTILTDAVHERRDTREKVETVLLRVSSVEGSVRRMEPIVSRLETQRIERHATRKFFGGLIKRGHAIWAGIGISLSGAVAYVSHWLTSK